MNTLNIPPLPKYKTGYSNSRTPRHITNHNYIQYLKTKSNLTNIENLLLTIDNSPIKSVVNEDLQRAIEAQLSWRGSKTPPEERNYNGVKFFMFNEPSEQYREDFERLLNQYQEYFEKITPNKVNENGKPDICIQHYNANSTYPTMGQLSCIDYKRRRIRDFEFHLNTTNDNKIINFFRKRIEHFDKCKEDFKEEFISSVLKNNNLKLYDITENNKQSGKSKKNIIFSKYLKYFEKEKKKEKNILNNYNDSINMIYSSIENSNFKNQITKNLKKEQLEKLSNILSYGPKNKNFNPNFDLCSLDLNDEKLKEFKILADKYIIPQNKKIYFFGVQHYYKNFLGCRTLLHVSPMISLFDDSLYNKILNETICHKYILWTSYLNYFLIIIALKKKMDIPLVIYRPQNKYHLLAKKRSELKNKNFFIKINENNLIKIKFIGVISIPFSQKIENNKFKTKYKYIFVFEHPRGKFYRDFVSTYLTPFLLVDQFKNLINEGLISPQNVISYDEIAYLYYLSKQPEKNLIPYFYQDKNLPNYIMVSLKDNLQNNNKYNLKKIKLDKWFQKNKEKKQFIFKNINNNSVNTLNSIKTNPDKHILATVEKRKNIENIE